MQLVQVAVVTLLLCAVDAINSDWQLSGDHPAILKTVRFACVFDAPCLAPWRGSGVVLLLSFQFYCLTVLLGFIRAPMTRMTSAGAQLAFLLARATLLCSAPRAASTKCTSRWLWRWRPGAFNAFGYFLRNGLVVDC